MSNQPKPAEIEDVLSSIRRLVAGGDPLPDPPPERPERGRDALLLTPSQRVQDGVAGPPADRAGPAHPADWLADAEADAAASRAADRARPDAIDTAGDAQTGAPEAGAGMPAGADGSAEAPASDGETGAAPAPVIAEARDATGEAGDPPPDAPAAEAEDTGALDPIAAAAAELGVPEAMAAESVDLGARDADPGQAPDLVALLEDTPPPSGEAEGRPETDADPEVAALPEGPLLEEDGPSLEAPAPHLGEETGAADAGDVPQEPTPFDLEGGSLAAAPPPPDPEGPRQGFGFGEARRRDDPVRHVPLSELPWPPTTARVPSLDKGAPAARDGAAEAADAAPAGDERDGVAGLASPGAEAEPHLHDAPEGDIALGTVHRVGDAPGETEAEAETDAGTVSPAGLAERPGSDGPPVGEGAPEGEPSGEPGLRTGRHAQAAGSDDPKGLLAPAPDRAEEVDAGVADAPGPRSMVGPEAWGESAPSGHEPEPEAGALTGAQTPAGEPTGPLAGPDAGRGPTSESEETDADARLIAGTMSALSDAAHEAGAVHGAGAAHEAGAVGAGAADAAAPDASAEATGAARREAAEESAGAPSGPTAADGAAEAGRPAREEDAAVGEAEALSSGAHGQVVRARNRDGALTIFDDAGSEIDEAALRALITDMVHRELQGALGERVSHNIRTLVRREIARALEARDLD